MVPKVASSTAASTASTNVVKSIKSYPIAIEHIADIYGFPFDSTMMDVIAQQGWVELSAVKVLVITLSLEVLGFVIKS
jgi:hypothetical protein